MRSLADPPNLGFPADLAFWPAIAQAGRIALSLSQFRTIPVPEFDVPWPEVEVITRAILPSWSAEPWRQGVKYIVFASDSVIGELQEIVGAVGDVVGAPTISQVVEAMRDIHDVCVVLDPALITPADANALVNQFALLPRSIVVYAPVANESLQSAVVLGRGTTANFVFHGESGERPALRRALLLAPNAELGIALVTALAPLLDLLPHRLRGTLRNLLCSGTGPSTPAALASHSALPRRSMDRAIAYAGLQPSHMLITAGRIVRGYQAITASRTPLRRIAGMLGYASQRTLDKQCDTFLGH